jgi:hypothetical protein
MPELVYIERTTNQTGSGTFIDAGTVSLAAGEVLFEFFCPRVTTGDGLGTLNWVFNLLISPFSPTPARRFAGLHQDLHSFAVGVYGQHVLTVGAGDYDISVEGGHTGTAYGAPPALPAWFRIVGDPFAEPPAPPVTSDVAIRHTFGLG